MSTPPKHSPLGFRDVLQLPQLGVDPNEIKYKNVSLSSHKFITVREEAKNSVAIIDTSSKNVLRLPVAVDSAIMNPVSKVIALRAQNNLQIYNLEMKSKMKSTQITEECQFWKWLDMKTIAIVTSASVYHWSMDGEAQPIKIFDRTPNTDPVQIINYRASSDGQWLILGGISSNPQTKQINGVLQVYSVAAQNSQPTMDSHAACFSSIQIDGRAPTPKAMLFCFTKITDAGPRLNILEVGVAKQQAFTQSCAMRLQQGDFPVSMLPDDKYGAIFIITKMGLLMMFDIQSGKCVFCEKASQVTMFASVESSSDEGGVIAVDQKGRVCHFFVDEKSLVPYIMSVMNDLDLAVQLARRYDLQGAEEIFKQQFRRLMEQQRVQEAMDLAASSPRGVLRTLETINSLKTVNQGQALLQYFQTLLKAGKLNTIESIELAKPVIQKGSPQGMEHIKNWIQEQKLEPSEELGDCLKTVNVKLALSVYLRANVPDKVISCFLSLGAQEPEDAKATEYFQNVLAYAKRVSFNPDYPILVQQLLRVNPDRAKDFALILMSAEEGAKIDIIQTVDTFMHHGDVKNTTNILLEYLRPRGDREEDGPLQTRLLEINLLQKPQVADAIMESSEYKFTHYDKLKIAQLCERAQLFQRALEHYTDLNDIKRVLAQSHALNPDFLLEYFGRMTPENCLECLKDLLKFNMQKNIRLVVEVAKKWNDYLTPDALINLFEEYKSPQGLYFYLGSFVNFTDKKNVVFKYIEAATKLTQLKEVERVCRDNEHYDAKEVKEFLLGQNLKDPRPLIHVCDRFGYVDELTQYLYSNNMMVFIEAYVQRMNPKATPPVCGTLLDLNCNEDAIKKLLQSVRPPADAKEFIHDLVEQVEKRNRLKILRPWLEERAQEGSTDVHVHNGLAKIYVDINNSPQQFLTTNRYYDSLTVGKYCESRDPHLSFVAYKRAWGECDNELIAVTNKNGFFKDQARYLVERQDLELWAKVLNEGNEHRRSLIDQVVATALPESRVPEEVSTTVKAFMAANLPNELIELLERIILHGPADGEFATNKNLQNLLILTAIKADKKRVMEYIKRLENYDGPDIAKIAVSDQYELFEEAFFIYKKFKKGAEAISVLLDSLKDIQRATEFAEYWDKPETWSLLGKAQLDAGMCGQAIASFRKADDPSFFERVIFTAKGTNLYNELIEFLRMARGKIKDSSLDNEMIYAFAKTERLADLEEFIAGSHVAKIQDVGDMCYNEDMFQAAKILYNHVNNNAKLAICLVRLQQYNEAVDAARKANAIPTWKAVCFACVDAQKFRLAQMCGLNIIVFMDHLQELINHYETRAHFDEVIALLEAGINLDRAHQGLYTQLGVLYCKYKEEKVMEHIRLFINRLNIPTLLQACQKNLHWPECVFLYSHYDQYDNAVDVLMRHSAEAWKHDMFKETIKHVSNTEVYYRAIDFYVAEHPLLLNDLLTDLVGQLDHSRVTTKIKHMGHLPLIEKYLHTVQRENLQTVNEAVNFLYLQQENYRGLRESIDAFKQFDQIALAQQLERHELMEFRRIAAYLYKLNKRWDQSIDISKKDSLWRDAMETCAESGDQKSAEALLNFFVDNKNAECFAACLFSCYELIRPDVVLELAWRNQLMNFAMPFMIQAFRDFDEKVSAISAKLTAAEQAKVVEEQKKVEEQANQASSDLNNNPLLLTMAPVSTIGGLGMGGMGGGMGMGGAMGGMGGGMGLGAGLGAGIGGGMGYPPLQPQFGQPMGGGFFP